MEEQYEYKVVPARTVSEFLMMYRPEHLSFNKWAKGAGVDPATMSRIRSGAINDPTFQTFLNLCIVADVPGSTIKRYGQELMRGFRRVKVIYIGGERKIVEQEDKTPEEIAAEFWEDWFDKLKDRDGEEHVE